MPDERLTSAGWASLGLAGSVAMTAVGPDVVGGTQISWWFWLHPPPGTVPDLVVFYAGMAALCIAWLGLGLELTRTPGIRPSRLVLVGALWCLPLLVGSALFSRDVYSYMAQGEILHLGLNPYHYAPDVLARLGHPGLLATVSPFWQKTTSPYGPLFIGLSSLVMAAVGAKLILGVMVMRLLELAGLGLLALSVPRLARAMGADPARATWLAVISPLVLLELIAAGHNDALMIGLLVAGVTLAIERHPLTGIVLCAIAATVKLPAAAGIVFIAAAWARAEWEQAEAEPESADGAEPGALPRAAAAAHALVLSVAATAAVLAAVGAVTGLGLSWATSGILSTPGKVHLAITPITTVAMSLSQLLNLFGVSSSARGIQSGLGVVALALTGVLALWLIRRTRYQNLPLLLGVLLLVSVFAGPATWPWYLTWGLALIACSPVTGRSWALPLALAVVLAVFLVKPNGYLVVPRHSAPVVLGAYAILIAAAAAWRYRARRRGRPSAPGDVLGLPASEQPALTNP